MKYVVLDGRIASLQQQLDDAVKEVDEMKDARRRQVEMVIIDKLLYTDCFFCITLCCYLSSATYNVD